MRVKTQTGEVIKLVGVEFSTVAITLLRRAQHELPNIKLSCKRQNGTFGIISVYQLNLDSINDILLLNPGY